VTGVVVVVVGVVVVGVSAEAPEATPNPAAPAIVIAPAINQRRINRRLNQGTGRHGFPMPG
jgi:hypothetical protein